MRVYDISKTSNPLYKTLITMRDSGLQVIIDTPEQFTFAISSTWESRLPGIASAAQATRDATAGVLGLGFIHKEETRQLWQGTTPIEVSLTLNFDAKDNAYNDVFVPLMCLAGMALPEENAHNVLFPPGPTRIDSRNAIQLVVGKYWRMDDGLMTSTQPTFDTRLAEDGYPISGQVEVTIRASITYSRSDFVKLGMLPSGVFRR